MKHRLIKHVRVYVSVLLYYNIPTLLLYILYEEDLAIYIHWCSFTFINPYRVLQRCVNESAEEEMMLWPMRTRKV